MHKGSDGATDGLNGQAIGVKLCSIAANARCYHFVQTTSLMFPSSCQETGARRKMCHTCDMWLMSPAGFCFAL